MKWASTKLPERFERLAHLLAEDLRLFPGREVAAFFEAVVVNQFGIRLLCPAPGGCVDLVGEGADGNRDLDAHGVEEAARRMVRVVPIELRRGDRGVRQPIERDVVEDVVSRQSLSLSVKDAGDHFLAARV